MSQPGDPSAVARSRRLFERLLVVYPEAHRNAYGPAMAQLFRDQCRDAWRARRGWGLAALWLRVVPDLVKTSLGEHLANLKGAKSMNEKINLLLRPRSAPRVVFLVVSAGVACLVFGAAALITFLVPESYVSTARIRVERDATDLAPLRDARLGGSSYDPYFIQTEFEVIQSELILDRVIGELKLNEAWAKKYGAAGPLQTATARSLLRRMIDLRPVRNTTLIEIRVYSDQPDEAAELANKLAEAYHDYRRDHARQSLLAVQHDSEERIKTQEKRVVAAQEKVARLRKELSVPDPEPATDELALKYEPYWGAKQELAAANRFLDELRLKHEAATAESGWAKAAPVEFVDRAVPGFRPVRPNKPLNLFLGAFGGMLLGLVTGAGMAWAASRIGRSLRTATAGP